MKMTFRWYGSQMDPIPLRYIKQIPNMSGVVSSLMDMPAGALWPTERIRALKQEVNDAGLELEVIESVNIHEDIKLGLPSRDEYIDNYRQTVARLGQAGVKVICYNFMPVFDWTRTDLAKPRFDGATVLAYDQSIIDCITDPQAFADRIQQGAGDFEMAGWEPERMAELKKLFAQYASVSHEDLFRNLQYFLKAVIPVCEQYDVKLAIHPDDPPFQVLGLPRIVTGEEDINWLLHAVDNPHNGLTFCAGSLSAGLHNNVPLLARMFAHRTHFVHLRSTNAFPNGNFIEASHLGGRAHVIELIRIFEKERPGVPMRVDHGRMMLDDAGKGYNPGYSFHGRMMALAQIEGMMAVINEESKLKS